MSWSPAEERGRAEYVVALPKVQFLSNEGCFLCATSFWGKVPLAVSFGVTGDTVEFKLGDPRRKSVEE